VTAAALLKLLAGLALIAAGLWQYRRRAGTPNGSYGSQSAVLLLTIGLILLIVALGGLDYRPSPAELGR